MPEEGDIYASLDRLPGPAPILSILQEVYRFQPFEVRGSYYNERTWREELARGVLWHPIGVRARPVPAPGPPPGQLGNGVAWDSLLEIKQTIADADTGASIACKRVQALEADAAGDDATALALHEEAAAMGDVASMYDAGCLASHLGLRSQALFWFEAGAAAGNAGSMYNLGVIRADDIQVARGWFERAAAAGDAGSCGALAQLAHDAGDEDQEFRWAELGAHRDQPFCMVSYGLLLILRSPEDPSAVGRGAEMMERGGRAGEPDGLFFAGKTYLQVPDRDRARECLQTAADNGDTRAIREMSDNGL